MRISGRVAGILLAPLGILLVAAVLIPAGILLVYSLYGYSLFEIHRQMSLDWYRQIADQDLYRIVARNTLAIAIPTTVISVVGGYAIGYYLVFGATHGRRLLLTLVVVAMLASYLARIYAWRTLMGEQGIVNSALISIGVTGKPVSWLLFSRVPVVAAEVNLFMPIAALISFASLSGVPPEMREVARDLGAGPAQTLRRITVPLSGRGLYGAAALTFFLSCGDYITPAFLGGVSSSQTIGTTISTQLVTTGNYPLGAALSFAMIVMFIVYAVVLYAVLRGCRLLPGDA
jgi:spermidine/putrescine transport system permease protein